tara:strand:+ start:248 stop:586 length:339 start_codon:yes stop_codon:yes gene_type:complete
MEKENEWIERKVKCDHCENGKVGAYVEWIPGKRCRVSVVCTRCDGMGEHSIWTPRFCQMPTCMNEVQYRCTGNFCHGNGWVCEAHWKDDDSGQSTSGKICDSCFDEFGWSGH